MTIRVALYVRVSTEEQAEHGYSIEAQLDTLRSFCKLSGKEIVGEYVDRGVSGKSIKGRYELQKLLKDAENRLFDEVVVWKISRIARKTYDLLHVLEILNDNNITFRSFSENFETETSMGRFALQMMGAVGELERNTIVDNVKLGMKQRAKEGRHNGKVPLGYAIERSLDQESKVIIVPNEALIVKKIYNLYAAGRGLKSIANELNHAGYKTKTGNSFSTSAIKDILNNPMYCGKIRYNLHENWSERRRRGKSKEPIVQDGVHEAIIPLTLWESVQQLSKQRSTVPQRSFDGEYLLTGLMKCPQCGAAMVASRTRSKPKNGQINHHLYYVCGNLRSKGRSVCSSNSIRKEYAEAEVTRRVKEVLADDSILQAIIHKMTHKLSSRVEPIRQELAHIRTQIAQAETKKNRYLDLFEQGGIDKSMFSGRLLEIQAELDRYHNEQSRLELELTTDNAQPISIELVRSLIQQFDQLMDASTFEQRKTLMHLVVSKIIVSKDKKIEAVELSFDAKTESYFFVLNPSASARRVSCASEGIGASGGVERVVVVV